MNREDRVQSLREERKRILESEAVIGLKTELRRLQSVVGEIDHDFIEIAIQTFDEFQRREI